MPALADRGSIVHHATHYVLSKGIQISKMETGWLVTRIWDRGAHKTLNDQGKWEFGSSRGQYFRDQFYALEMLRNAEPGAFDLASSAVHWAFAHKIHIMDTFNGYMLYQEIGDGDYARGWNVRKGRWGAECRGNELNTEKCSFPTLQEAWAVMAGEVKKAWDKELGNHQRDGTDDGEQPALTHEHQSGSPAAEYQEP